MAAIQLEKAGFDYLLRHILAIDADGRRSGTDGILCQDPKFDKDRFREIMDIMLDAVCSTALTIRINGEDMPQQVVKSRFLKLNSSHIEYVLEAMNKNPSDIRNIRAYLLTALYNASLTIDNYYSALVNHDFYGQDLSLIHI